MNTKPISNKPDNEDYLLILGQNIASLRKKKKISQITLSLDSGIARSFLADLERGKANPSVSTLLKIAKALGVEVRTLFPR